MQEQFALRLYREFLGGKSVAELSGEFGIPVERIEARLRAAGLHLIARPDKRRVGEVRIRIGRL